MFLLKLSIISLSALFVASLGIFSYLDNSKDASGDESSPVPGIATEVKVVDFQKVLNDHNNQGTVICTLTTE